MATWKHFIMESHENALDLLLTRRVSAHLVETQFLIDLIRNAEILIREELCEVMGASLVHIGSEDPAIAVTGHEHCLDVEGVASLYYDSRDEMEHFARVLVAAGWQNRGG